MTMDEFEKWNEYIQNIRYWKIVAVDPSRTPSLEYIHSFIIPETNKSEVIQKARRILATNYQYREYKIVEVEEVELTQYIFHILKYENTIQIIIFNKIVR